MVKKVQDNSNKITIWEREEWETTHHSPQSMPTLFLLVRNGKDYIPVRNSLYSYPGCPRTSLWESIPCLLFSLAPSERQYVIWVKSENFGVRMPAFQQLAFLLSKNVSKFLKLLLHQSPQIYGDINSTSSQDQQACKKGTGCFKMLRMLLNMYQLLRKCYDYFRQTWGKMIFLRISLAIELLPG